MLVMVVEQLEEEPESDPQLDTGTEREDCLGFDMEMGEVIQKYTDVFRKFNVYLLCLHL